MLDKLSPMAQWHVVLSLTLLAIVSTLISHPRSNSSSIRHQLLLSPLAFFRDPATVVRKDEERCTYTNNHGVEVQAQPDAKPATIASQVASHALLEQLHLDVHTRRPIWTSGIIDELDQIVKSGKSISGIHYPHSAEDVALAIQSIGGLLHPTNDNDNNNVIHSKVVVGVVQSSNISPWVEHVLRSQGASHVITMDINEPIICSGIEWITSKSIQSFGEEVDIYDLLVSFSGIEHLDDNGDFNNNGDLMAMEQMHKALVPGGYLLLAVPTADRNYVEGGGTMHRIYGPDRMAQLIQNFEFVGRVWDGRVFGGWEDVDSIPRLFITGDEILQNGLPFWQYQNVLILRKKEGLIIGEEPMMMPELRMEEEPLQQQSAPASSPYTIFDPKQYEGKLSSDVEGLQDDGTYLLLYDYTHRGPNHACMPMVEEQDRIQRVHYHFDRCDLFDKMFGNRLGTIYGMKMIAYAMNKPFSFTCGMAEGESPLGASFLTQLNSGVPGPVPHRNGERFTPAELCERFCEGFYCTWYSNDLDFAVDAMIADWKFLASPEVVSISDYDDAVIHLRLGDGLYSTAGDNEGKGVFPHATYINLLKQAEKEKGTISSIGIVTAPFKGSHLRNPDRAYTSLSEGIALDLIRALQLAFPTAGIRLHNDPDDTIIGSLARILHASKVAVCGCSTFCPYALLATDGIGYMYNPAGFQNLWVRNAASWSNGNFRLFDTPMLNGLIIANEKTGYSMPETEVFRWIREQDPAVGNIDITSAPIFRKPVS